MKPRWSKSLIVDRIQEWTDLYGEPPRVIDWNPTGARERNHPDLADRFLTADGRWPHMSTVVDYFGSWNQAIEAAGYKPRSGDGFSLEETLNRKDSQWNRYVSRYAVTPSTPGGQGS